MGLNFFSAFYCLFQRKIDICHSHMNRQGIHIISTIIIAIQKQ